MKTPLLPADLPRRDRPQADKNIAALPLPKHDPIYSTEGPLRQAWR